MTRTFWITLFMLLSSLLFGKNESAISDSLNFVYNQSILDPISKNYSSIFVTKKGIEGYGFFDNRAGFINIRGVGQGRRVAIYRDGIPMNLQIDGMPLIDIFNMGYVDNISIEKGSSSLIYGKNAFGGVVNITSFTDTTYGNSANTTIGYGSFNTQNYNLNSKLNRDKFISNLSLNYKSSDGHRANSDFSRFDLYLRTQYKLNGNYNLKLNGSFTDVFSRNPGIVNRPLLRSLSDINIATISFELSNKFSKANGGLILYTTIYRNSINEGFVPSDFPTEYQSIFKERIFGVRGNEDFTLKNSSILSAGFDYSYNAGNILRDYFKNIENNQELLDANISELSMYAILKHKFFDVFTLEGGIRYTNNKSFKNEVTPHLGFVLERERYSVNGKISKGYRSPSIMELYYGNASNPDLLQESAVTYESSIEYNFLDNRLFSKFTLFYIDMWNMVEQKRIMGIPKNLNTGFSESKGFELDFRYTVNDIWKVTGNYSLTNVSPLTIHVPESIINLSFLYSKYPFDAVIAYSNAKGYCINIFTKQKNSYSLFDFKGYYHTKIYGYRSSFFVLCDNLLGESYSINQGFRMPGVTFFLGFELKL